MASSEPAAPAGPERDVVSKPGAQGAEMHPHSTGCTCDQSARYRCGSCGVKVQVRRGGVLPKCPICARNVTWSLHPRSGPAAGDPPALPANGHGTRRKRRTAGPA